MHYVPYWKSKRHIFCFFLLIIPIVLAIVFFIASMAATVASSHKDIKEDPVVTTLISIFVVFILSNILTLPIFIIDLVSFFVAKHRAKTTKENNVEVVLKDSPVVFKDKDTTLRTAIGDGIVADVKTQEEDSIVPEIDSKIEFKPPSYKIAFLQMLYGGWNLFLIIIILGIVLIGGLEVLFNLKDLTKAILPTAIFAICFIAFFALLIVLFPLIAVKKRKNFHPEASGVRIYGDTLECYMDINQELDGQNINAKFRTKFNFSKAKHKETKNLIMMKQTINKQLFVFIITKDEDPALTNLIREKFKK